MQNLVITDSAGKLGALSFALKKAGLPDFQVVATNGPVMDHSHEPRVLGVDMMLREPGRRLVASQSVEAIRHCARGAQRVLLATDADQEGDVLACDIAQAVVPEHRHVLRIRVRGLDVHGVAQALAHPEPVRAQDAWPGTARRILDRLVVAAIGLGQAAPGGMGRIGRVQAALLGAAAASRLPLGRITLVLSASDTRAPFVATMDVFADNVGQAESLLGACAEFFDAGGEVEPGAIEAAPTPVPWSHGEAVLAMAQATGRSPQDVAHSLWRLYESGRLSYPCSDAKALTPQAVASVERLAQQHAVRIDPSRLPLFTRHDRHAHETPYPLAEDADLSSPVLLLSQDDAVLALCARHLVSCAQPHVVQRPDPASMPAWAAGLDFKRVRSSWLVPWARRKPEPGFSCSDHGEQVLSLMLRHQLGHPSSQVTHASSFASRGLLGPDLKPSDRGRACMAAMPPVLMEPAVCARIERLISEAGAPDPHHPGPATVVRDLLDGLGLWPLVEQAIAQGAGDASIHPLAETG